MGDFGDRGKNFCYTTKRIGSPTKSPPMSAKQPVPETPKPKGSKLPDQKDFLAWWRGAANCRNSDQCCKLLGVLYRNGSPVVTEGEIKRILRPERETSKGLESERKYLEKPVRKLNKRLRDLLNVPITEPALVQSGYLDDIKGYKLDVNRLLSLIPEDELQILQGVEIPKRSIFTVGESAEVQSTPFIILAGAGALQYIKLHLTEANAYIENGGEIRVLFVLSDIQIAVSLADALNFKIQGEDQPERNIHFLVIKGKQLVPGTYAIRH